jgi:prepilin-type N-terminal cleavage/methylation domain-containing protein
MRTWVAQRRVRGLSMIEVLAAMVIFSSGAAVLFGWIGQVADRIGKLSVEQRALFVELTALEYLKTLNPMLEPAGRVELPDAVSLRWSSALVGDIEPTRPSGSLYEVGLYRVELRAVSGATEVSQTVMLAGWRQVRELKQSNPFGAR